MPKCTLYLSEEDNPIYLDLKKRGENPSALFSKAIRARAKELDAKTAEMMPISIFDGSESHENEYYNTMRVIKFVGKEIARDALSYEPQYNDGLYEINQTLFATQKGNYLLYQIKNYPERYTHEYFVIEKGKMEINVTLAPKIFNALGIQDDVGTFLDI